MGFLPKSRTARRRLMVVAAIAPVLALAVGLGLFAMRDAVSLFLTPSQAMREANLQGRSVQLGGFVRVGSVERLEGDEIRFTVADSAQPNSAAVRVVYKGVLPDLFREGQGVVTKGTFENPQLFRANSVLAKHDERYMPREMEKQLKASGEWRGDGATPSYSSGSYSAGYQ